MSGDTARLHEAGHEVTLLARGRRREEFEDHGVVLWEAGSDERTVTEVPVVDRLAPEDDYDLVVMVRGHRLPSVLEALTDSESTSDVLFILNNVSGPQRLADALGRERILLGFPVAASPTMDAWLKTHAAVMVPLAAAVHAAGGDASRLARTPEALVLTGCAPFRRASGVLSAPGAPVTPAGLHVPG